MAADTLTDPPNGHTSFALEEGQQMKIRLVVAGVAASFLLFGCNNTPCDPTTTNCGTTGGTTGGGDGGSSCPALTGAVMTHDQDINADETWAGDGTIHRWTFGAAINPGATLTVAACAVVQMGPGLSMTVRGSSSMAAHLVTQGTATQPVLFTGIPDGGAWGNLANYDSNGTIDLSYTTLQGGGSGTYHGSTVDLKGDADPSTTSVPVLRVNHVTITGAAGTGLVMESGAGFTADSTELTVTGGGAVTGNPGSAIEIQMQPAGTLPTLHVSGNAIDQILISAAPGYAGGSHFVSRDLTIKNLGVPYYMYFDRVSVTDPGGSTPTLTIAPGVELRFDDYLMVGFTNAPLSINQPGVLHAVGTAAQPIVFTSSKPAPAAGDWPGIFLRNAAGSLLQYASIQFAGGANGVVSANCKPSNSSDNAALFIGDPGASYIPNPSDFVSVTVANSASHGINAMWVAPAFGPDLTPAFTFDTIDGCRQTKNALPAGCMSQEGCFVP
jgi:hypothetical protein